MKPNFGWSAFLIVLILAVTPFLADNWSDQPTVPAYADSGSPTDVSTAQPAAMLTGSVNWSSGFSTASVFSTVPTEIIVAYRIVGDEREPYPLLLDGERFVDAPISGLESMQLDVPDYGVKLKVSHNASRCPEGAHYNFSIWGGTSRIEVVVPIGRWILRDTRIISMPFSGGMDISYGEPGGYNLLGFTKRVTVPGSTPSAVIPGDDCGELSISPLE